jgi:hypothetical protein
VAAPFDNSQEKNSNGLLPRTGEGVVIDIGTGDGRFVSAAARKNPAKFYIGIDANIKPLEKISMKATRNPAKGGLPNVLFIQAAIENLPEELDATADEIHIHFPWGSLLRAVISGDEEKPPEWSKLETSWARKLQGSSDRRVVYLVLQST